MRFRSITRFSVLLLLPIITEAQSGRLVLPDFSALAEKASESVNISLDPSMLGIAGGFLSADPKSSDARVKDLLGGLQGVYVRSFKFK
jgi:hypothetical protein